LDYEKIYEFIDLYFIEEITFYQKNNNEYFYTRLSDNKIFYTYETEELLNKSNYDLFLDKFNIYKELIHIFNPVMSNS
jgi:hypothetical protein